MAEALLEATKGTTGIKDYKVLANLKGSELEGTICHHPFNGEGYDFDVPLLPGDHVTLEAGTGLVHTAPGHGVEDFGVGRQFNLECPETVGGDGLFYDHVPLFAGQHVYKVDPVVIEKLQEKGALLGHTTIKHSYPHSWRSKTPLIFRTTPQWFVSMETDDLRDKALAEISRVKWHPKQGENRIRAMIESRPDWCISRQRSWGIPLMFFVKKGTRDPLKDEVVNQRIQEIIAKEGSDAWYARPAQDFLGEDYKADDYEQAFDIMDVWFESGSTNAFVLEGRQDLTWPADLYLEGSDQHRGWFQVSLLEACANRGKAPFEEVLTHGFVVDEKGYKMSKSLGNFIAANDMVKEHGADILRLWVVTSDFTQDLRIGPDIIQRRKDIYRRIRNTLKYMLGNMADFQESERLEVSEMPELEQWVHHRIAEVNNLVAECTPKYDFQTLFTEVHNFCSVDLSDFYFDIRKDRLYCDDATSIARRACRTTLVTIFNNLCRWISPVLCFTADEAWGQHYGPDSNVHLEVLEDLPASWINPTLHDKWDRVRDIRRVVTGAIEIERAEKRMGSSLQASVDIYLAQDDAAHLKGLDLAEISITSVANLTTGAAPSNAFTLDEVAGIGVVVSPANGEKCDRCWRILPEVQAAASGALCHRCNDVVKKKAA